MDKIYDVYGIGNPIVDILAQVDDSLLKKAGINKGVMQLINKPQRNNLLHYLQDTNKTVSAGGSCANTLIALANLGLKVIYGGAIGHDRYGEVFEKDIDELHVNSELKMKTEEPTGSSIILITKDTERSMNTFLGACRLFSREDIDEEKLAISKILYFTGYMWDTYEQKDAIIHAINIAKQNDVKIIFDVADPFSVINNKIDFVKLIKNHIDFVFANKEEAKKLVDSETNVQAVSEMIKIAKAGAIKIGASGSYVFQDGMSYKIEPNKVEAIDTTGAGDMYAAGVIYGLAKGYHLEKSGQIASLLSSKVVEKIGARLDDSLKEIIKKIE